MNDMTAKYHDNYVTLKGKGDVVVKSGSFLKEAIPPMRIGGLEGVTAVMAVKTAIK
jgi:hypothetical protein